MDNLLLFLYGVLAGTALTILLDVFIMKNGCNSHLKGERDD